MFFPFNRLSNELALEIIRLAAEPDFHDGSNVSPYATARALCLVSHAVRRATAPHLLHTVVLPTGSHLTHFIDALELQHTHHRSNSSLTLDYTHLVHRFWSDECYEPLVEGPPEDQSIHYDVIYNFIRRVPSLGMNFQSTHLLYNGFNFGRPAEDWSCTRLTFSGEFWRWRPFTSNAAGQAFLAKITHLVLWIPDGSEPACTSPDNSAVPQWLAQVPFTSLTSLTHLAFPLLSNRKRSNRLLTPTEMLVYTTLSSSRQNATDFREWAFGGDPLSHGVVVPFHVEYNANVQNKLFWQQAYSQGQSDYVWRRAKTLGGS